MAKSRIRIPEKEQRILFAKSGNICAFPDCDSPVIADVANENRPIAEMAHIIAYSDDGPRSDPSLSLKEKNKASNSILLCPTHHTLVDKFEYQFNVHVLREMKLRHERKFSGSAFNKDTSKLLKEPLHASLLPLSRLPFAVFAANTTYTKNNIHDLFDILNPRADRNTPLSFELRDKKLYTFHDLRNPDNLFRETYDHSTVELLKATDLWLSPDEHRLYVALLNRALKDFLGKFYVKYDGRRYRYYFLPGRTETKRIFTYTSLSGRKTTKSVVNNPVTKATGKPKSYWVHLAANLSFQHIASRQWVLTIRPERHLTKDGLEIYSHTSIGRKITRIKKFNYGESSLQMPKRDKY